jgi:GNAT superfamily N-acetyltransferase
VRFTRFIDIASLGILTSFAVTAIGPEDIDAFVASVSGLFEEDAGRHDHAVDVEWPLNEGVEYYSGLVTDPSCLLAVARDGGRVVGHLVGKLSEPTSFRPARFAVLESMRVEPDSRGRGVGGLLVREFTAWARECGAEQASVTTYAANDGAQRFYARHGFAPKTVSLRAKLR